MIEGGVSYGQFTILEDDHIENGYALLDVAIPVSDCVIVYGEAVKEAYYDGYSYVDILCRGYNGKYSSKKINNE